MKRSHFITTGKFLSSDITTTLNVLEEPDELQFTFQAKIFVANFLSNPLNFISTCHIFQPHVCFVILFVALISVDFCSHVHILLYLFTMYFDTMVKKWAHGCQ